MKEQAKEILTKIYKKDCFEVLALQAYKETLHDHPNYGIKLHEAMSVIKRFYGAYYNKLLQDGDLTNNP